MRALSPSPSERNSAAIRFRRALELFPDHARSLVGLAAALKVESDAKGADAAFGRAKGAIDALRRGGRTGEAGMAEALHHAVADHRDAAVASLQNLLERAEVSFTGWTIPVEPLFESLRAMPAFQTVLSRLGERAR